MDKPGPKPQPAGLRPQLRDVAGEHLEEFCFLSLIRGRTLFAPDVSLRRLHRLEQRLAAHWDGLAVGCPMSLEVAEQKIISPADQWEAYGALRVWLELGDPAPAMLIDRLAETEQEGLPPWREALCRSPRPIVRALLPDSLLDHPTPSVQSTALFALGWHGLLPPEQAEQRLRHPHPLVRYCLARALAWSGWPAETTGQLLAVLAADEHRLVARAALWSTALLDPASAADHCRRALAGGTLDPFAVKTLGLLGHAGDIDLLLGCAAKDELAATALRALGDLGTPASVPHLLPLLTAPPQAAPAAEAVQAILGPHAQPILQAQEPALRRQAWQQMETRFAGCERLFHGLPWSGGGDPEDEPVALHWRRMLLEPASPAIDLKKECPDAWFTLAADGPPSLGM